MGRKKSPCRKAQVNSPSNDGSGTRDSHPSLELFLPVDSVDADRRLEFVGGWRRPRQRAVNFSARSSMKMLHVIPLPSRREGARDKRIPSLIRRRPAPHQMVQGQRVVDLCSSSQTHHPLTPSSAEEGAIFMTARGDPLSRQRIYDLPARGIREEAQPRGTG